MSEEQNKALVKRYFDERWNKEELRNSRRAFAWR